MKTLKFIDLFSGIGGFHYALKSLDMKCVFASEINESARITYLRNFKDSFLRKEYLFTKNIWDTNFKKIPDFDILCAGFPCQPFSHAGKRKGFKDKKDGNLFFAIEEILKVKKPIAFFLENVSHIKNHNGGKTFKKIYTSLKKLNYTFNFKVIKACEFGLAQYRPRVYMVGFYKPKLNYSCRGSSFEFPNGYPLKKTMSDILEGFVSKKLNSKKERKIGFTLRVGGARSPITHRRNWDGYYVNNKVIRIKPKHGLEMMGFNQSFKFPVSEYQAMKQLGNSVAINVVREIGKSIKIYLDRYRKKI